METHSACSVIHSYTPNFKVEFAIVETALFKMEQFAKKYVEMESAYSISVMTETPIMETAVLIYANFKLVLCVLRIVHVQQFVNTKWI